MSSDIAISVKGISKAYTIAHGALKRPTFRDVVEERIRHPFRRPRQETFWALKDVSFDVKQGEVVGIIGRNGAGKSTLLKILSRITEPTAGRIELYGRVGSLLEVGTGFHPELTGRENVFLNGAILGMTRAEIRKQFDAIVDFAEVEQFIDTPVKRYSSGMYVRLAFAVAAHLNPEILIVDEVLAVGDAEFQKKCLGKMGEVAKGGRTVLFVSHNMAAIRVLCPKGVFLERGGLRYCGPVEECIDLYVANPNRSHKRIVDSATLLDPDMHIDAVLVNGSEDASQTLAGDSQRVSIEVRGTVDRPMKAEIEAQLSDKHRAVLGFFSPGHGRGECQTIGPGRFTIARTAVVPLLNRGVFFIDIDVTYPNVRYIARLPGAVTLSSEGTPTSTGAVFDCDRAPLFLAEA
jgi:lipopolysaccharide transport system ATP-binding protein